MNFSFAAGVALATGPLVALHLQHTSSPPVASLHLQVFQNFLFTVQCFKEQSRLHLSISPVSDFSPGLGLLLSIGDSKAPTPLPASHWPLVALHLQHTSSPPVASLHLQLTGTSAKEKLSFQLPYNSGAVSILQQVPVIISAEELRAKDISPYDVYSYNNIPRNSMPHVIRLRTGNVVFNYKYYNNILQRSEVTEDYSCPFCLVKCASYKGLKLHLVSSHDLFRFEFWVNEDYQVVIVSVKSDTGTSEIFGNIADPRQQSLFFCRKPLSRKEPEDPTLKTNHVLPSVLDSDVPATLANLRGTSS